MSEAVLAMAVEDFTLEAAQRLTLAIVEGDTSTIASTIEETNPPAAMVLDFLTGVIGYLVVKLEGGKRKPGDYYVLEDLSPTPRTVPIDAQLVSAAMNGDTAMCSALIDEIVRPRDERRAIEVFGTLAGVIRELAQAVGSQLRGELTEGTRDEAS